MSAMDRGNGDDNDFPTLYQIHKMPNQRIKKTPISLPNCAWIKGLGSKFSLQLYNTIFCFCIYSPHSGTIMLADEMFQRPF